MSEELSITSRPVSSETENIPSEDTPKTSTVMSGEQSITSGPLSSGTENVPSEDTLKTSKVISDELSITSGPMSSGAEKVDTLKTSIAKSETSTNEVEGQRACKIAWRGNTHQHWTSFFFHICWREIWQRHILTFWHFIFGSNSATEWEVHTRRDTPWFFIP